MATAAKTADRMSNQPAAADIEAKIAQLKDDISGLGQAIADLGAEKARGAKSEAEARVTELSNTAETVLADLQKNLKGYEDQLNQTVRQKPLASLGIAAGLGFLIALIMRR